MLVVHVSGAVDFSKSQPAANLSLPDDGLNRNLLAGRCLMWCRAGIVSGFPRGAMASFVWEVGKTISIGESDSLGCKDVLMVVVQTSQDLRSQKDSDFVEPMHFCSV